jgi:hypothetical protein
MDAKGRQDLMQLSKAELVARVLAGVDERALRRYPSPPFPLEIVSTESPYRCTTFWRVITARPRISAQAAEAGERGGAEARPVDPDAGGTREGIPPRSRMPRRESGRPGRR